MEKFGAISTIFLPNQGNKTIITQSKKIDISLIYKINFLLFLIMEKPKNKNQTTKVHIQKYFSNQTILFGFMTIFIISQKFPKVKTQKKTATYPKKPIIQSLAKEITQRIHTISNKDVNFIQKLNQTIIQTKNKYKIEKFLSSFIDK
ncbi:MAG: hypothetical protein LBQ24_05165 [Candidatus Peribacteria bacterium]|jgi:hypothetical protein|nr:hypothetical protein [Candidatus Peribacteria bacterium]